MEPITDRKYWGEGGFQAMGSAAYASMTICKLKFHILHWTWHTWVALSGPQ